MYYELYVDVLFLVNFMMDYILLLLVRRMLKCNATHLRVCLGAVLTCIVIIIPFPYSVKFLFSYFIINTLMLVTGLKIKKIHSLMKAMILLYIGTFLMGGMMGYVRQYVRFGGLLLFLSIAFYYAISGMWNFLCYLQRKNNYICKTMLLYKGKTCEVTSLIDTGNCLKDAMSGAAISILDKKVAQELFEGACIEKLHYIPYHSIGKSQGVMPVLQIDGMHVYCEEEYVLEKPWIAISEEQISKTDEYQMILNPNLF